MAKGTIVMSLQYYNYLYITGPEITNIIYRYLSILCTKIIKIETNDNNTNIIKIFLQITGIFFNRT